MGMGSNKFVMFFWFDAVFMVDPNAMGIRGGKPRRESFVLPNILLR
jgi:hypothetical protein